MTDYEVKEFQPTEHGQWNKLVFSCANTCAFHSSQWHDALQQSFRQYKKARFVIMNGKEIVGVLPCLVFNPIPMVKMLHSMPWNLFGGPLFKSNVDVDLVSAVKAIDQKLNEFVDENSICEMLITLSPHHDRKVADTLIAAGYEKRQEEQFTHLLRTDVDYEVIWSAYNKRVRGAVRKSKKCGVTVYDSDSIDDLKAFYEIYLASMERFGSTPKPFSIMRYLQKSDIAKLAIAKYEDKIIAGLLYLFFNRTVTLWCGASTLEDRDVRPNNAIFHHIIKWASENEYDWVDFGASPPDNKGLIAFKEEWRAKHHDFSSYIKIHSPLRRKLWTGSEETLRKVYSAVQRRSR